MSGASAAAAAAARLLAHVASDAESQQQQRDVSLLWILFYCIDDRHCLNCDSWLDSVVESVGPGYSSRPCMQLHIHSESVYNNLMQYYFVSQSDCSK